MANNTNNGSGVIIEYTLWWDKTQSPALKSQKRKKQQQPISPKNRTKVYPIPSPTTNQTPNHEMGT